MTLESDSQCPFRVSILGDSRVFDTYFATPKYGASVYGYQETFPHVLQRTLMTRDPLAWDCVHIPDHFRGGTVENNILRLALTDPACVVFCDGIWESLISRKHLAEFVEQDGGRTISDQDRCPEHILKADKIVELFAQGKLALSPHKYAERLGRIVSWFARRRRRSVWMTMPIPPAGHRGGVHFAGDYRPFPGWHDCLAVLNAAATERLGKLGCEILDLGVLMASHGGASECLIDQWHFSPKFHRAIARELEVLVGEMARLPSDHISRKTLYSGGGFSLPVHLIGDTKACSEFKRQFGDIEVAREMSLAEALSNSDADQVGCVYVLIEPDEREERLSELLASLASQHVVLLPDDLMVADNPSVSDRSSFGKFK